MIALNQTYTRSPCQTFYNRSPLLHGHVETENSCATAAAERRFTSSIFLMCCAPYHLLCTSWTLGMRTSESAKCIVTCKESKVHNWKERHRGDGERKKSEERRSQKVENDNSMFLKPALIWSRESMFEYTYYIVVRTKPPGPHNLNTHWTQNGR